MGTSTAQAYGESGSAEAAGGTQDLYVASGGGKTSEQKAMNSVVQVNPAGMDQLIQQGAGQQQSYYQQGLNYYADSVGVAAQQLQSGYAQANSTLTPLSQAGTEAMNQELQMMGLPAQSQTATYANTLNGIAGSSSAALQQQMQQAELIQDPAQRQEAQAQVLQGIQGLISANLSPTAQQQIAALGPQPTINNGAYAGPSTGAITGPNAQGTVQNAAANQNTLASQEAAQAAYNSQVQQIQMSNMQGNDTANSLQQLYNNYSQNYSVTPQNGYNAAQVSSVIAQTPGYQFAAQEGAQAVARSGAAAGMLTSGNTGAAEQQFGQNLATSTYNSYMNNLQNISSQGSVATGAIAANQVNQGQGLASLATGLGSAVASTYQATGNALASADDQEAQLNNTTAMFNAQLQYDSKQANLGRQVASTGQALAAAPGLQNAATNAQQFSYSTYAQQAAANAYGTTQPTGAYSSANGLTQAQADTANAGGMLV